MKKILFAILINCMMVQAQTLKTYSGRYPGLEGKMTYTYYENESSERIYHGKFNCSTDMWLGKYLKVNGSFKHNKRDGKWSAVRKYTDGSYISYYATYKDGEYHGKASYVYKNERGEIGNQVFMNFNKGTLVGEFVTKSNLSGSDDRDFNIQLDSLGYYKSIEGKSWENKVSVSFINGMQVNILVSNFQTGEVLYKANASENIKNYQLISKELNQYELDGEYSELESYYANPLSFFNGDPEKPLYGNHSESSENWFLINYSQISFVNFDMIDKGYVEPKCPLIKYKRKLSSYNVEELKRVKSFYDSLENYQYPISIPSISFLDVELQKSKIYSKSILFNNTDTVAIDKLLLFETKMIDIHVESLTKKMNTNTSIIEAASLYQDIINLKNRVLNNNNLIIHTTPPNLEQIKAVIEETEEKIVVQINTLFTEQFETKSIQLDDVMEECENLLKIKGVLSLEDKHGGIYKRIDDQLMVLKNRSQEYEELSAIAYKSKEYKKAIEYINNAMELKGEVYNSNKIKIEDKIQQHKNNIKNYKENISYYSSNIRSSDFNKDKLYPTYQKVDDYIQEFKDDSYMLYQKDSITKRHSQFYLKCKKLEGTRTKKLRKQVEGVTSIPKIIQVFLDYDPKEKINFGGFEF